MVSARWKDRLIPAGLLALGVVPLAAGAVRFTELAGGGPVTPENDRFFAMPVPIIVHIVCVSLYVPARRASSSRPGCVAAGRAGTGWPAGSWCRAGSGWRCPGSG